MRWMASDSVVVLGLVGLVFGCGGSDPGEPEAAKETQSAGHSAADVIGNAREAARKISASESVDLVSTRRLESFLPESLGGLHRRYTDRDENPKVGVASAEARYGEGPDGFDTPLRIEITYFGKDLFNRNRLELSFLKGSGTKIAGLDALEVRPDAMDGESQVRVRVAPDILLVAESDELPLEKVKATVQAIDLTTLASQAADGTLMKPSAEDRIAEVILRKERIGELVPERIGSFERLETSTSRSVDSEPMMARAQTAYMGLGRVSLRDYGSPELAREHATTSLEEHPYVQSFGAKMDIQTDEVQHEGLDVYRAIGVDDRQGLVLGRAFAGRFVLDFEGMFPFARGFEVLQARLTSGLEVAKEEEPAAQLARVLDAVLDAVDLESLSATSE